MLYKPDQSNELTLLREGKPITVVLKTREMLP
jgi:hypothetical protein